MNNRERNEVNALTKDVVRKIDELCTNYRVKIAEVIGMEEEKAERLEEHFSGSSQMDAIEESIETLEDTLAVFEEALDMMKGVEYV